MVVILVVAMGVGGGGRLGWWCWRVVVVGSVWVPCWLVVVYSQNGVAGFCCVPISSARPYPACSL